MSDVDLTIAADTSAAAAGFAELSNYAGKVRADITREFSQAISFTGITGALGAAGALGFLDSIVEKAHQIHLTSERFGVDAQQLQTIGNAASLLGIPFETVARTMGITEINAYKAAQGSKAQAEALEKLGIDAQQFYSLNPEQKQLALADAYVQSADKGEAYANIAQIIGRRNTEMIALYAEGAQKIKEQGDSLAKFNDQQIASLNLLRERAVSVGGSLSVFGADFVTNIFDPIGRGIDKINQDFAELGEGISRVFHGDISGGLTEFFLGKQGEGAVSNLGSSFSSLGGAFKSAFSGDFSGAWAGVKKAFVGSPAAPAAEQQYPPGTLVPPAVFSEETSGSGGGSGKESDSQKLADLDEKNRLAALSDGERLNDLLIQRQNEQIVLNDYGERGLLSDQEILDHKTQIAKLDEQIIPLQKQITDEAERQLEKAVAKTTAAEATAAELQASIGGHKDLYEFLKKEGDLQEKIDQAVKDANEAWSEGDQKLALQNTALAQALGLQQQLLATARQVAQTRAANDVAQQNIALGLDQSGQSATAKSLDYQYEMNKKILQAQQDGNTALADQLTKQRDMQQQMVDIPAVQRQGTGITPGTDASARAVAAGVTGVGYSDLAQIMATDPNTGKVDQAQLQRYRALEMLNQLRGGQSFSVVDVLGRQKLLDELAAKQQRQQDELQRQQKIALEAYYSAIYTGGDPAAALSTLWSSNAYSGGVDLTGLAPRSATLTTITGKPGVAPGSALAPGAAPSLAYYTQPHFPGLLGASVPNVASTSTGMVTQLQQQVSLLQQQLTKLTSIDSRLRPAVGSHG